MWAKYQAKCVLKLATHPRYLDRLSRGILPKPLHNANTNGILTGLW